MYEDCKGVLKHAWDEIPTDAQPGGIGDPHWFICGRCGTIRKEGWNHRGELMWRKYVHPKDWKDDRPRDSGGSSSRVTMLERRAEYAHRVRMLVTRKTN